MCVYTDYTVILYFTNQNKIVINFTSQGELLFFIGLVIMFVIFVRTVLLYTYSIFVWNNKNSYYYLLLSCMVWVFSTSTHRLNTCSIMSICIKYYTYVHIRLVCKYRITASIRRVSMWLTKWAVSVHTYVICNICTGTVSVMVGYRCTKTYGLRACIRDRKIST